MQMSEVRVASYFNVKAKTQSLVIRQVLNTSKDST
jgi:hypothetical protein